MDEIFSQTSARSRRPELVLVALASLVAIVSARNYAGGWNDGSRLATVESLVDRHTLSIDGSIFVRSPATVERPNPYEPGNELLGAEGTKDKLFIGGHYYSDKSPLPAFWLAACYQLLQWTTGLTAEGHPRWFCYLMTLASSGLAYVVSIWALWRLALREGLPPAQSLLLAASLALATLALPYARHVNNHILLLAVLMLLMPALDHLAALQQAEDNHKGHEEYKEADLCRERPWWHSGSRRAMLSETPRNVTEGVDYRRRWAIAAGFLAGLAYTFDLGLGPVLLFCTTALVAYRTRSLAALTCFGLAALPCLVAHHAVNYATGGTIGPANSVAEYLTWPGSPFSTANMTGGWAHGNVGHFALYTAALLMGKHGFLSYNLPLLLPVVGLAVLARRRVAEIPELVFAAAFAGGTWLIYGALSNNYAGPCCSVRWFVPLLAPAYYVLVLLLRERPALARELALLSLCGAVLSGYLWWRGPWDGRVPMMLWPVNGAAIIGWLLAVRHALRVESMEDGLPRPSRWYWTA